VSVSDSGIKGDRAFPATATSIFRSLGDPGSPEYRRKLERLVQLYWKPVYCVIRHAWSSNNQDAKDLTQDFFEDHILEGKVVEVFDPERGSFRSLLRATLLNFLRGRAREERRPKRGGGATLLSLDPIADPMEGIVLEGEGLSPEQIFDSAWNQVLVGRAVEALEARLREQGKEIDFLVFKRYDLEEGRDESSYADIAKELRVTPAQVRHGLSHAREALEEIIVELARDYVDGPEDLARELRKLFD
jgi:RNA polymerase sigma-70 factor (ECF subfamily)